MKIELGWENGNRLQLVGEDVGHGEAVVLIHGWPCSSMVWEDLRAELLAAGHRVVTYDRRGFGRSARPSTGYDLDTLTEPQVREMFIAFIANTIETRLFQEIGANGLSIAADNVSIETFQAQLGSYIERGVRDSFSSDLGSLSAMSDGELRAVVDTTYREAWDLFEAWGALEQ